MGQVDHIHDSPNQAQPHGGQSVDRANEETINHGSEDARHVSPLAARSTTVDPFGEECSVHRVNQISALACQRPDYLFHWLTRLVLLPLCQKYGVADLQTVLAGRRGKFRATVKRRDVGAVQRGPYLGGVDSTSLFDGVLQNQSRSVTARRFITGRSIVLCRIGFAEVRAARAVLCLEGRLWFPLRGYDHAQRR